MADPLRLYGLNALVFNAGSGIGEASARTLIKHGATVLAVDSRNSGVEQHFASVKGITGLAANIVEPAESACLPSRRWSALHGNGESESNHHLPNFWYV